MFEKSKQMELEFFRNSSKITAPSDKILTGEVGFFAAFYLCFKKIEVLGYQYFRGLKKMNTLK